MQKKWNILSSAPESFYEEHPELPQTVANLLYHRNMRTQKDIDEFLNPDYSEDVHDPFLFQHMEKAVARLFRAIEENEHIVIHGDYDADGVCASVILTDTLKALGASNIEVFLPHRETDGYGMNTKTIQYLADKGAQIIISCDCGISNTTEVALANEKSIDVIITDHHSIPKKLPDAFAIIHPKIDGETYPDKNLAGGGVAFKLAQGLLSTHKKTHETLPNGQSHEGFEKWLLEMVAISSVADMVPLIGESRTLTKYGLIVLNKTKRIGLQKLLLEARLMEQDGSMKRVIDATTIGFRIAPRINAAGRLDHANVAYRLLVADNGADAIDLAWQLDQNNKERQQLTDQYVKEATIQVEKTQKDKPFLFVYSSEWTTGIVGLIASRIKEKYQKPTIAMSLKQHEVTGSGRSIDGFNLIAALQQMPQYFTKFGGHPMACGFTLVGADIREKFQEALIQVFQEKTMEMDLTPTLDIDAQVTLEDITWELYDVLEQFAPFGQVNPEPKYVAKGLTVVKTQPIGKQGKHLRIMVKHNTHVIRKTIGWRLCSGGEDGIDWGKALRPGDTIDMVFEVGVNEWNGNRELQLTIVDLKKSE